MQKKRRERRKGRKTEKQPVKRTVYSESERFSQKAKKADIDTDTGIDKNIDTGKGAGKPP